MIVRHRYHAVRGGGEWVGLDPSPFGSDRINIGPGRVGRTVNPLRRDGGRVTGGGWPFRGLTVHIEPENTAIDIVLHKPTNQLEVVVRTLETDTIDADEFELVLPLLRKADDGSDIWSAAEPFYGGE